METHQERAEQLMADPNFEIGSHGFAISTSRARATPTLNDEILLTEAAYAQTRASLLAKQCAADVLAPRERSARADERDALSLRALQREVARGRG